MQTYRVLFGFFFDFVLVSIFPKTNLTNLSQHYLQGFKVCHMLINYFQKIFIELKNCHSFFNSQLYFSCEIVAEVLKQISQIYNLHIIIYIVPILFACSNLNFFLFTKKKKKRKKQLVILCPYASIRIYSSSANYF